MSKISKVGLKHLMQIYNGINNIPVSTLKLIPGKILKGLDVEDKEKFISVVIDYWYKKGFPYQEKTIKEIKKEYKKLLNHNHSNILVGKNKDQLAQHTLGLGSVNSFHPQRWSVRCRTYRTPIMIFNNRNLFEKVLFKCIDLESMNPLNVNACRKVFRFYSNTQLASNFRPTVAKYFYKTYCPPKGKVLDPSMGYSGRLFGALASHISLYEGCEPSTETFKNNVNFHDTISKIDRAESGLLKFMEGDDDTNIPNVKMHNIPFEEYDNKKNTFDLVFTSPPYFNIERYCDEDTQSWKRYPEYTQWVDKFLKKLISTSYKVLKPNGYFIINIAGKVGKYDLEKDFVYNAETVFGKLHHIVWLKLSKMVGTKTKAVVNKEDHKLEPCFIFKK